MDVLSLFEELEQLLENGSAVPFSKKVMLDKEQVDNLIGEIRMKIPDELKQARWIKEERARILADAQKEAQDIIKEAEDKIIFMIDDHEITKQAYEKRAEILDSTEKYKRELIAATKEHADSILEQLENTLKENLDLVKNNRKELK